MPPLLGWLPGTISGTEETRNSRLVPQLPRTRIRRPKCDKCSRLDSPSETQPPALWRNQGVGLGPWNPRAVLGQQTVLGLSEEKSY